MESDRRKSRTDFIINIAYWTVIIALIYVVLKYFLNLVMPFFIATVVAALGRPIAIRLSSEEHIRKKGKGKFEVKKRKLVLPYNVSAVISVIIVYILTIAFIAVIISPVIGFTIDLVKQMEVSYEKMIPQLRIILRRIYNSSQLLRNLIDESIPNIIGSLGTVVTDVSSKLVVLTTTFAASLPTIFLKFIICFIATLFISIDYTDIKEFIQINLRTNVLGVVENIKDSLVDIVLQFLKSYFLIFLITTAEITLGLLIIGIEKPLMYAVLIAVFDAFPIVGSGMILFPWSVIRMISVGFWDGFWLFILYVIVVVAREIIEPKIVGKKVGLRPIVTLFCMYVGTKLFGGIGLFALPITAAIIVDLNESGTVHIFRRKAEE